MKKIRAWANYKRWNPKNRPPRIFNSFEEALNHQQKSEDTHEVEIRPINPPKNKSVRRGKS